MLCKSDANLSFLVTVSHSTCNTKPRELEYGNMQDDPHRSNIMNCCSMLFLVVFGAVLGSKRNGFSSQTCDADVQALHLRLILRAGGIFGRPGTLNTIPKWTFPDGSLS